MNGALSRLTSRPSPISYGVYRCDVDQRLLAAEEVDVDQQQPGLDARDVERQHAGRLDVERLAAAPSARPTPSTARPRRHPDLVAEIAGVAGARDVDRHAGDRAAASRGSTSAASMSASATARSSRADVGPCSASAATCSEMSSICDVQPGGVLPEPAQARIGRRPPEHLLVQPRHRPVVDHLAALVAPRRVEDLARPPSSSTSRVMTRSTKRAASRPGDEVLEQRRDVDQRRGVADRVVLVLVVRLVGADRVVARPLAVVQALAEREACARGTAVPIGMGGLWQRRAVRRDYSVSMPATSMRLCASRCRVRSAVRAPAANPQSAT